MGQEFAKNSKKFGFGCMRLPMKDGDIDFEQCNRMVDIFMEAGFSYFDTAKGYLEGLSEVAIRECVVKRYPRESFTVTDKLTAPYFECESDIRKVFEAQLETCGVTYFDYYLMHAQGKSNYGKFQECRAYEVAQELKAEGKIRHVGLSFHDDAEFLEMILTQHPEVELVQIQLNYLDYEDVGVQSRKCLEVCEKHNKPVVVMEPVKGGSLVNLPPDAEKIIQSLGCEADCVSDDVYVSDDSGCAPYSVNKNDDKDEAAAETENRAKSVNAGFAIRFAASCKQVFMVLSGMSSLRQMQDNINVMKDFRPFNESEYATIDKICEVFNKQNLIPCTACRYCVEGCPQKILIPDLFADLNAKNQHRDWNSDYYYNQVHTQGNGKASECIKCGKCEKACPQHLEIRKLLEQVAGAFEG